MLKAEKTLRAINKLGEKNIPLTRVYRCLFNEELYLLAYGKLYKRDIVKCCGSTLNQRRLPEPLKQPA